MFAKTKHIVKLQFLLGFGRLGIKMILNCAKTFSYPIHLNNIPLSCWSIGLMQILPKRADGI